MSKLQKQKEKLQSVKFSKKTKTMINDLQQEIDGLKQKIAE